MEAAVREVLPIAVAMLPVNAAVYVFDGIITGASDFRFMAGGCCAASRLGRAARSLGWRAGRLAYARVRDSTQASIH